MIPQDMGVIAVPGQLRNRGPRWFSHVNHITGPHAGLWGLPPYTSRLFLLNRAPVLAGSVAPVDVIPIVVSPLRVWTLHPLAALSPPIARQSLAEGGGEGARPCQPALQPGPGHTPTGLPAGAGLGSTETGAGGDGAGRCAQAVTLSSTPEPAGALKHFLLPPPAGGRRAERDGAADPGITCLPGEGHQGLVTAACQAGYGGPWAPLGSSCELYEGRLAPAVVLVIHSPIHSFMLARSLTWGCRSEHSPLDLPLPLPLGISDKQGEWRL